MAMESIDERISGLHGKMNEIEMDPEPAPTPKAAEAPTMKVDSKLDRISNKLSNLEGSLATY